MASEEQVKGKENEDHHSNVNDEAVNMEEHRSEDKVTKTEDVSQEVIGNCDFCSNVY